MSLGSEQKKAKKKQKSPFWVEGSEKPFHNEVRVMLRALWVCESNRAPGVKFSSCLSHIAETLGGLLQLSGSNSETPPTKKQSYLKVVVMTMSTCDRLLPSTPSTPSHPCLVVSRSKRQGGKPHCYTDWGLGWGLSNSMWHENTWKILHHDATCCMLQ